MIKPSFGLNGSYLEMLREQHEKAGQMAYDLRHELCRIFPHGRDYPDAGDYSIAKAEFSEMISTVAAVERHMETMVGYCLVEERRRRIGDVLTPDGKQLSNSICTCASHCANSPHHERACCDETWCRCWCHADEYRERRRLADGMAETPLGEQIDGGGEVDL